MKKLKAANYTSTTTINLSNTPTLAELDLSDKRIKKRLERTRLNLADFQNKMYAHGKYGVLICVQGMDTSGKDSLIREVFKELNVRGIVVHSFKKPTTRERRYNYLWRHYLALPERGKFSIFNRTHYENVLVSRVHPEIILEENLPHINRIDDISESLWENRFEEINNFEQQIVQNGTLVFKFFLHISKGEQRKRLLRRLEKPNKNWKFSPDDLKERALWNQYQDCYEKAINNTSTSYAPWYIIPSDCKKESRLIFANILYQKLSAFKDIKEPVLANNNQSNLEDYKVQLINEGNNQGGINY